MLQSITAQNSAVAFIFYGVAMVVNLVMMQSENYLNMLQYTGSSNTTSLNIVSLYYNYRTNIVLLLAFLLDGLHSEQKRYMEKFNSSSSRFCSCWLDYS